MELSNHPNLDWTFFIYNGETGELRIFLFTVLLKKSIGKSQNFKNINTFEIDENIVYQKSAEPFNKQESTSARKNNEECRYSYD